MADRPQGGPHGRQLWRQASTFMPPGPRTENSCAPHPRWWPPAGHGAQRSLSTCKAVPRTAGEVEGD